MSMAVALGNRTPGTFTHHLPYCLNNIYLSEVIVFGLAWLDGPKDDWLWDT
jgi:hypothetical protein